MHADALAALGQWGTNVIAIGAALIAFRQVREARKTRESVAQPNVVVFTDRDPINSAYRDLVIKNFGQTPAYNIKVTLDAKLDMVPRVNSYTHEKISELYIPDYIAVLAPGQEWRTVWDSREMRESYEDERKNATQSNLRELRSVYEGCVSFEDKPSTGKLFENPVRLDWNIFLNTWMLRSAESEPTGSQSFEILSPDRLPDNQYQISGRDGLPPWAGGLARFIP